MEVLVVEADTVDADTLARDLDRNGHHVKRAETGSAALKMLGEADLVLLNLELPDIDGLAMCRAVRMNSDVPVISVTEREDELDRVLALQAGSDDCLVKPLGLRELLARIEAIMRRVRPRGQGSGCFSYGGLTLDSRSREVRLHGDPVSLTRKEFDLLHLLVAQPSTVISRKDLMSKVWGYVWPSSSRTVDMHVSSLRKKLGNASWIVTVHGVGFRLGVAST
ncbi:MAG TPA: response regulator transcription factor [Streptosporangiaceae bacterium]|nr:response regulator transcription factor [Streptosporangiaceae bacterium]